MAAVLKTANSLRGSWVRIPPPPPERPFPSLHGYPTFGRPTHLGLDDAPKVWYAPKSVNLWHEFVITRHLYKHQPFRCLE